MAKTASRPKGPGGGQGGRFVEYDRYIDQQLGWTRNQVRSIDAVSGLMTLAAASLGFFLVAAILDHWLIPGGLGFWGRALMFVLLAGGAGYYVAVELLPLFIKRINPVYAAHTIERSSPSLKNSLVNFLLLKKQREGLPEPVYHAIEEQAATGLSQIPVEAAVDRSRLIRVGYVLVGLLAVAALYKVLSPKDPITTAGRVVLPWADIQPPTRVSISEVEPGATQAFRGQRVEVSAEVHGLASDGQVNLVFATADGKSVNQQIRMTVPADSHRYSCQLPEGSAGLQQDVDYHIEAGDARTKTYRVTVVAAPTIVVQSVDYVYPDYTGLARQSVEHQPDLKAIEGTRVTLHALANQAIKSGAIDFNCDGREDKPLDVQEDKASVNFKLEVAEDRHSPQYASYQLRFRNQSGQENPQPIAHRIEVTPDLPPEIEFLHPKSAELNVPARGSVGLEIVAHDPDFALRRVTLQAKVNDKPIADKVLLDELHKGQFVTHKLRFDTARLGLRPGELVEYWAVAEDNKAPGPNRVETRHRWLRIVSPEDQPPQQDQLVRADDDVRPEGGQGQPEDQEGQRNPADDNNQQKGKPQDGQRGKSSDDQPGAGDRNAGQGQAGKRPDQQQDQPGDQSPQAGGERQADKQQSGKQGQDQQEGPAQQGGDQKGGQQQKGSQQAGDQRGNQEQGGGNSGGGKQNAGQQNGQRQGGEQGGQGSSSENAGNDSSSSRGQRGGNDQKGQKGQSGQKGAAGDDQQPVANDGSDDGSAIERILQDRQKHGSGSPDDTGQGSAGNQGSGEKSSGKADKATQRKPGNSSEQGSRGEAQSQVDKNDRGGQNQGSPDNSREGNGQQPGDRSQEAQREHGSGRQAGDQQQRGQEGRQPRDQQQPDGQSRSRQQPGEQGGKGLSDGQQGADRSAQPGDRQDNAGSKGQPGDKSDKNQPAQGDDSRAGDRPEQGSAPGQQKRRGGERSSSDEARGKEGEKPQPGDNQQGGGEQGRQQRDPRGQPGENQQGAGERGGAGDRQQADGRNQSGDRNQTGDQQSGQRSGSRENSGSRGNESRGSDGQGERSKGDTGPKEQKRPGDEAQQAEQRGGDGQDEKGQSGAGNSDRQKSGSPAAQGNNQQRDKTQSGGGRNGMQPNDTAQSPTNSDRQSDSQSNSAGDRSGGGASGGGQKANKEGTGGAGQNSEAEDGAGKGKEPGEGETGGAGDRKQADGQTGSAGTERGKGSTSRRRPRGADSDQPQSENQQPGEQEPQGQGSKETKPGQPNPQPGKQQPADGQQGKPGNKEGQGGPAGGQPTGQGPGSPQSPPEQEPEVTTPPDDPNLDYARKATDLALEHLRDQMKNGQPDPELMKKLGWSRDDLKNFLDRWEAMRRRADQQGTEGDAGRRDLDAALRSLGLRPRSTKLRSNAARDDQARGLKESRRTQPPPEYAEQYKAYTQGTSRGGK